MAEAIGHSDGYRELVEGHAAAVAGGDVSGEFVVAAAQILHGCMTCSARIRRRW